MDCVFSRRRTQPIKLPTLVELFTTATLALNTSNSAFIDARNNSSTGQVYLSRNNIKSFSNPNNIYAVVFFDGYISFWQLTNPSTQPYLVNTTAILKSSSSYCGMTLNNNSTGSFYYYSGGYSTTASPTSVYGATMTYIQFSDNYTTEQINAVLSHTAVSRLAYRNNSSTAELKTNNKSCSIYITAGNRTISWWDTDGTTYNRLYWYTGNEGASPTVSSGYLTMGTGWYGGTIVGLT